MSEYRGRGRGFRGAPRGRGGGGRGEFSRGGGSFRGGRGDYSSDRERSRGGGFRGGRGDGFSSRGRGGPSRYSSRDESPPRKTAISRSYDGPSDRERGPPIARRDKFEDSYDRAPPSRSRDAYPPAHRDSARLMDRLSPPRSSFREKDYGPSSRDSKPEYLSSRAYSPPRDSGFRGSVRDDRDAFSRPAPLSRPAPREYPPSRLASDYSSESRPPREYREPPRDYPPAREYPPSRASDYRSSLDGRGDFIDRAPAPRAERLSSRDFENGYGAHSDYPPSRSERPRGGGRDYAGASRFSSREDRDRSPLRGPREYVRGRGSGGYRGSRGGREDRGGGRGSFMNGRGRGPPRGRGGRPDFDSRAPRSEFSSRGGRRSPPMGRDAPPRKAARMDASESYRR